MQQPRLYIVKFFKFQDTIKTSIKCLKIGFFLFTCSLNEIPTIVSYFWPILRLAQVQYMYSARVVHV